MVTYPNSTNAASNPAIVNCFYIPPTQREVSGYTVDGDYDKGTIVPMGTPIYADTKTKKATICKYAVVTKKVDAKNFIVRDLGFLAVGDKVFASGKTTLSEISAIDKTKKQITLKANNNDLEVGSVLLEGKSEGEGVAAVTLPNRIVAHTATLQEVDKTVSGTYQCVAIQNVLNYPDEYLNKTAFPGSTLLVGCPTIHFVHQ